MILINEELISVDDVILVDDEVKYKEEGGWPLI